MQASYDQYMPYLFSRAGAAGVPLAGTFELTCRCNFDCRMCYIHRSQFDASARAAERDAAWWLALARSARDAGMLTLLLTGGEPLLRPDFPEIYTACRNLGLLVSVNTNGTLLTPELVQLLAHTPPQRINLTLYGASRETYAALCGRPKAYDRVLWAIDALQAAGVPLKLNFTETPYNQADAPAVYAFARARGLRVDAVTYCFPPVRARENGACTSARFSPEVSAREQVRYDRFRFGEEGFRARARALLDGQTPPPADACQELPTEKIRCRAGLSTFWVTWDGQLRLRHDVHAERTGRGRFHGCVVGDPRRARADPAAGQMHSLSGPGGVRPLPGGGLCRTRGFHRRAGVSLRAHGGISGYLPKSPCRSGCRIGQFREKWNHFLTCLS